MSDALEDMAAEAVSETLRQAGHRPAACAALMRLAGQALARLTSHDEASRIQASLARRHAERAGRS
jgi:hypothetical protein